MKYTLLDIVQTVLAGMSSDEVNSINDNAEATTVARMVRSCYYDIVAPEQFPENFSPLHLDSSGDVSKPTLMFRPANVNSIKWLKYNKFTVDNPEPNFVLLTYKPLEDFFKIVHQLKTSDSFVLGFNVEINGQFISTFCRNDVHPLYYTTLDDNSVIFDAYDSTVDSTLQSGKTLGYGHIGETFQLADGYVPKLDDSVFPLLLREVEAQAWHDLKNTVNVKAEKKARRHWINSQFTRSSLGTEVDHFRSLPNYGRK